MVTLHHVRLVLAFLPFFFATGDLVVGVATAAHDLKLRSPQGGASPIGCTLQLQSEQCCEQIVPVRTGQSVIVMRHGLTQDKRSSLVSLIPWILYSRMRVYLTLHLIRLLE